MHLFPGLCHKDTGGKNGGKGRRRGWYVGSPRTKTHTAPRGLLATLTLTFHVPLS